MSNFTDFARGELERAKMFDDNSVYGGMLGGAVMRMIEVFAEEGHSGASAALAAKLFTRLVKWEPLTPLTGEDDEWIEVYEGTYQNKRCPHVFKNKDGAYNIQGKVFVEPSGASFVSHESRVPVTFPYWPETEIVKRGADES